MSRPNLKNRWWMEAGTGLFGLLFFLTFNSFGLAASANDLFREGTQAYSAADYSRAARAFRAAAAIRPAIGTLQNLGNAEWERGRPGPAIVAWEQSLWLAPFDHAARNNLRFARRTTQLEAPDLTWYEVVSTWLPVNWWAWLAGLSLWLAVGMTLLPGIFRWRRATWQQAIAALALMVFLLSVPAQVGVHTRARLGFVLEKDTPLLLTPTADGQIITRLAPGEPARCERTRGNFFLIRTSRAAGWIESERFGLLAPKQAAPDPT